MLRNPVGFELYLACCIGWSLAFPATCASLQANGQSVVMAVPRADIFTHLFVLQACIEHSYFCVLQFS